MIMTRLYSSTKSPAAPPAEQVQRSKTVYVPYTANDVVRVTMREIQGSPSASEQPAWSGLPSMRTVITAPVRAVKWFIAPGPLGPMPG